MLATVMLRHAPNLSTSVIKIGVEPLLDCTRGSIGTKVTCLLEDSLTSRIKALEAQALEFLQQREFNQLPVANLPRLSKTYLSKKPQVLALIS